MAWSLQISDGDFTLDGSNYGTVMGQAKLVQEFRCAILEEMGLDNLHPDYGSLIDGGINSEGVFTPGVIGETDQEMVALMIEAEVSRIARYIQQAQLARAKQDRFTYGRATLTPEEVLLTLNGVSFLQKEDSLQVTISLTSAINGNFDIDLTVNTNE